MKILIREITTEIANPGCETEYTTKIIACETESSEAITRIPNNYDLTGSESVNCSNDNLSTAYEHAESVYWENMRMNEVTEMLENAGHKVVTD